jgi:hypothetical protein
MPSTKKTSSPKSNSKSPKLVSRELTENESKRLKARFDFSKYPTDKSKDAVVEPMKKRLTANEFGKYVDTLRQDLRNLFTVISHTYGAKEKYYNWDKTLAKRYVGAFEDRLKMAHTYYKYRPPSDRKSEKSEPPQLLQTLLVFQNFKDWINNVNMGNGLAQFMAHREKNPKYDEKNPSSKVKSHTYDVNTFIEMANERLAEGTSIAEIDRLLRFHPASKEGNSKYVFNKDIASDKHFVRILEIINAYRTQGEAEPMTEKEALAHVVPQEATLGRSNKFNVQDILNMDITTSDGKEHTSAAINPGMSIIIMTLMANANNLYNPQQTKYVDYQYFSKYFGGTDNEYAPTKGTGFYLDDEDLMNEVFIKGLPDRKARTEDSVEPVIRKVLGLGKTDKSTVLDSLVARIVNTSSSKNTALSFAAAGGRKKKSESKSEAVIEGVGVRTYTATQLAFYNRIPDFLLSDKTKEDIASPEVTKQVKTVQKHFSSINEVYTLYAKLIQRAAEKDARAKAKAKKAPKTPSGKSRKDVTKSPTRVASSPTAASPRKRAASPGKTPSPKPKSSSPKTSSPKSASPGSGSKSRRPASSGSD